MEAAIDKKVVGKKFQKSYFDVLGICCSSEVPMIEKILKSLEGVRDVSVVVTTKTVIVVHDSVIISQTQIVKVLNESRLEANIKVYGDVNYKNKWPSPYVIASGILVLLSFLNYFYAPLQWLAIGAVAVGIVPIILKAIAALGNFTIDVNILVLIAVGGSIALHDFWEAGVIVFLFRISQWLESRASHKATAVMSSLVSVVPQRAVLADTGEEVDVDEVKLNTILAVKAGETIPIDGIVVQGNCEMDEKILTGESFPVAKEKDSIVWASTINLNGYICVRTTAVPEDCVVARMAKLVEEAQNNKSRTQRFVDKCAKYYTPVIVLLSAGLAVVPLALQVHNMKQWYHLSLVVLVSGCPCALVLSTPVAMFCALSKAATLGILFKGAEHLENLARVKIMAFDKTGTITKGEFQVTDIRSLKEEISLETLLYWISSIESKSSHPVAAALVDYVRAHKIDPKPDHVENFQNFPGEGISGEIEGNQVFIGNWKISSRAGCNSAVPRLQGCDIEGKSVNYVFWRSSLVGVFCLSDVCRTGAKEAIEELKSMGIKTVMLTGDCHAAAKHAQAQLGGALDIIHSELLPDDKSRIVKALQKEGPTAMIGDGVNDAPALATSDVGISMGVAGSALASETGDVILMSNNIQIIPKAAIIAKKVRRKIIENVVISISTKLAIVGLAIGGHPLVWAAVLTDVGTCLIVILNSMLLLKGTPTPRKRCENKHRNKKCCSENKCGSSQAQSLSSHCHSHDEPSVMNHHRCCEKGDRDLESQIVKNHYCSEKVCATENTLHNHGNHSTETCESVSGSSVTCDKKTSKSLEHEEEKCCGPAPTNKEDGKCCGPAPINKENGKCNGHTPRNYEGKCCGPTPMKRDDGKCCGPAPTNKEDGKCCGPDTKNKEDENCHVHNPTPRNNEKKCCDSFRIECGVRNGHLTKNLSGGLPEIVIE